MSPEQKAVVGAALAIYGAHLTEDGHIAKGDKTLSVRFEVRKGRLRALAPDGHLLASFPSSRLATGVADFVERFWYWKPDASTEAVKRAIGDLSRRL